MYFQLVYAFIIVCSGIWKLTVILTLKMNFTYVSYLHLVFQHRINNHLDKFKSGWDCHPLSTERNKTPNHLWVLGQVNYSPTQDNVEADEYYGIDIGNTPYNVDDDIGVHTVDVSHALSDAQKDILLEQVDIYGESDNYDIDIYLAAIQIVCVN